MNQQFLTVVFLGAIASIAPMFTGIAEANADLFGAKDLTARDVVAIAVPIDQGEDYNLLILEQLESSRDCWKEKGNTPTVIDPLLLNFDFTNICGRSTDSNGYSLRLAGEEMAWRYTFRLVREGNELKLKAFNSENSWRSPIEVGSTKGITAGMLKIQLNQGWRMAQRTYQGKTLGHIYIVSDQSANQLIAHSTLTPKSTSIPTRVPNYVTSNAENTDINMIGEPRSSVGSVQIFVPPSSNKSAPVASTIVPMPPISATDLASLPVLPVPNKPIPASDMVMSPPPPPSLTSRAMTLGLRYRVVVDAQSPSQKDTIKSIVPDAFNTWVGDRRMMQVGAYADETQAQEMSTRLSQSGFVPQILPVR